MKNLSPSLSVSLLIINLLGGIGVASAVPVVTWIRPLNGTNLPAGSNILLTARATNSPPGPMSFVEFYANSNLLGTIPTNSITGIYNFSWSNAPAGIYQLHAEAVDTNGVRGISGSVQITVNPPPNVVPVVTWLEPPNGANFTVESPIVLSARATDSDGTINFVDFFANNTSLARVTSSFSNNIYSFVWSNAPAGSFQLRAETEDNQGARGISGSVGIVVSDGTNPPPNAVPVVTWLQPPDGSGFRAGSAIQVRAQATDSDGTVSFVDFFAVPTNGPQIFLGRSTFGGTNGTYTGIWSNAPAGQFELHAEAVDNAGGTGISGAVGIVVTNPPPNVVPVVTWLQPPDGSRFRAGSPIQLRAQATDSDGTVSFVDFFAVSTNGPQIFAGRSTFGGTNGTYTVVWSNSPAGEFQLRAEAQDNQGGRGISGSVGIVVTNPPPNVVPVVTWLQPPDGSSFLSGSPIQLRAQATDSDGTVSFVDFFAATNGAQMFVGRSTFGGTNGTYTVIWSNAPAGEFQLHAEAQDNQGGRGISGTVGIVVTNPPPNVLPVVTWLEPPDGSGFPGGGSPIVLQASATDSDGTVSFVDFFAVPTNGPQIFVGRSTFGSTNDTYTLIWSNTPAGQFRLHAEAQDNRGGRGISGSVGIVVTNPPPNILPVVTWVQPANGATVGGNISLRARATDSDGTISFVEFFATPTNGPTINVGRGTLASSDGLYIRGWTNPPAGQYELHAEAVDNAGGRGISGSVTVNVGEAPIITSQPQSQTVTSGATVTFSVTATGTAPLSYRWRRNALFIPGANSSTLTLSNVTSTNAGVYSVVVTNLFGSRTSSNATLTVIASNSPPVVTLTSPTNGSVFLFRQPIVLRAFATDSDGTVSFVDFFANTTLVARAFASGTNFNFMSIWSNAPAGSYDIRAVATDNSGAQAVSDPASITVLSNRPPTAFDQAVSVQENSSVAITLQGSDPDGDSLTFVVLTSPAHGTLSGSPPSLTYTPDPNYFGPDSFTFAARDQDSESAPATVQITVTRVNHGPVAQIDIPNALTFLGAPTLIAVTGDFDSNATATVILDASQSFDPDGDPLTYLWSIGNVPFNSGVRVTNEIAPGDYLFQLTVSDGELSATNFAQLTVLTPCEAIDLLIIRIDESSLDRGDKRPLIKALEASCTAFVNGEMEDGIELLEAFQHKVEIRIGDSDPAFAEFLINEAQTLIDAIAGQ